MPRLNVIILDQQASDPNTYNYVLWADVPAARQAHYATANATSRWTGATTQDNTNLQNGSVAEQFGSQRVLSSATLPQIEAFFQAIWTGFQASVTANNPWIRYGSTWDGTTWTVANNG